MTCSDQKLALNSSHYEWVLGHYLGHDSQSLLKSIHVTRAMWSIPRTYKICNGVKIQSLNSEDKCYIATEWSKEFASIILGYYHLSDVLMWPFKTHMCLLKIQDNKTFSKVRNWCCARRPGVQSEFNSSQMWSVGLGSGLCATTVLPHLPWQTISLQIPIYRLSCQSSMWEEKEKLSVDLPGLELHSEHSDYVYIETGYAAA